MSESFFAVLDSNGFLVDQDASLEEAEEKARHYSSTGTFIPDGNVSSLRENDGAVSLRDAKRGPAVALRASRIEPVAFDDWYVDLDSKQGQDRLDEAYAEVSAAAKNIYKDVLKSVEDTVHIGRRGGVAKKYSPSWLRMMLRQNQKMAKILEGSDDSYDSIGLSLLPHGAAFREPFSTSTNQGAGGASYCAFSTAECRRACLVNTGQRALESGAFASGYLYSILVREHTAAFMTLLFERCIEAWRDAAEGRSPRGKKLDTAILRFIRLNVLSDLPWELIAPGFVEHATHVARKDAGVADDWQMTDALAFYDYTKIPYRRGVEGVYDLTWSFTGGRSGERHLADVLVGASDAARRAAVVFVQREADFVKQTASYYRASPGKRLASEDLYHSWTFFDEPVWNGDLSDVRPLDPDDVKIVGLIYKVSRYKVEAPGSGTYSLKAVVPSSELDTLMPTFLVRVMQPDPDAPPVVVPTQEITNRKLVLPDDLEIVE